MADGIIACTLLVHRSERSERAIRIESQSQNADGCRSELGAATLTRSLGKSLRQPERQTRALADDQSFGRNHGAILFAEDNRRRHWPAGFIQRSDRRDEAARVVERKHESAAGVTGNLNHRFGVAAIRPPLPEDRCSAERL